VFKQGTNIKPMCPNYTFEFRNTKSHVLQVCLGAWAKIETAIDVLSVKFQVIVITVFKHYHST